MTIERNEDRSRFEIPLDGHTAFLDYAEEGNVLELIHTEVPEELEGRGLGSRLAKGAIDYARERGKRVKPTCPFVRSWLERHPDEADVVDD